ncbi:MAG: UDP-glucose 4-epimerase GalE [Pseudomonadota bacterium]
MSNAILVTGGAGYIGSHVVRQLGERGERTVTLDDLATGFSDAVLYGSLVEGNTGDRELVMHLLDEHQVDAVMHFAAFTIVPESVADPLRYYQNNTAATLNMLRCCREVGVRRFIFSSTAAVYGTPASGVCEETDPTAPINPYGSSKLMSEWMLRDLSAAGDIDYVALRYFNVAGCDPGQRIGQSTRKATLLTKVTCEVAAGVRDHVKIFGTDYDTPDGTGVRDYIHVEDLADAHVRALDHLRGGGDSLTLNCGYGRGFSVREVIDAVARAHGSPLKVIEEGRRAGDPPTLIARADRIRDVLQWSPRYDDLDVIVRTALAWEHKLKELRNS